MNQLSSENNPFKKKPNEEDLGIINDKKTLRDFNEELKRNYLNHLQKIKSLRKKIADSDKNKDPRRISKIPKSPRKQSNLLFNIKTQVNKTKTKRSSIPLNIDAKTKSNYVHSNSMDSNSNRINKFQNKALKNKTSSYKTYEVFVKQFFQSIPDKLITHNSPYSCKTFEIKTNALNSISNEHIGNSKNILETGDYYEPLIQPLSNSEVQRRYQKQLKENYQNFNLETETCNSIIHKIFIEIENYSWIINNFQINKENKDMIIKNLKNYLINSICSKKIKITKDKIKKLQFVGINPMTKLRDIKSGCLYLGKSSFSQNMNSKVHIKIINIDGFHKNRINFESLTLKLDINDRISEIFKKIAQQIPEIGNNDFQLAEYFPNLIIESKNCSDQSFHAISLTEQYSFKFHNSEFPSLGVTQKSLHNIPIKKNQFDRIEELQEEIEDSNDLIDSNEKKSDHKNSKSEINLNSNSNNIATKDINFDEKKTNSEIKSLSSSIKVYEQKENLEKNKCVTFEHQSIQ